MEYYVYVLFSSKFNQIYVGYSTNVDARLLSHNVLGTKGWTIRYRPWMLVHKETFNTKKEAMAREKQLKSGRGREWIRKTVLNQL